MPNAANPLRVEVAAERPIECAHAAGPAFILSEEEIASVAAFLERTRFDAELAAFSVVGFWVSHTRSNIGLTLDDQELYKRLFPYPWQIVLVVKPENASTTRATFIFRANGRVQPNERWHEFGADGSLPAAVPRSPEVEPLNEKYQPIAPERRSGLLEAPPTVAAFAQTAASSPMRRMSGVWPMVLLMFGSAAAGGALTYYLRDFWQPAATLKGHDPDLNLEIFETASGLLIHWNSNAVEIQDASRGELDIQEGGDTRSLPLSLTSLRHGFLTYKTRRGNARVTIKIFGHDGAVEHASAYYPGNQ